MNTNITVASLKSDYIVNVRPANAYPGHTDGLSIKAFDADDAQFRIQSLLNKGVRTLDGLVDYVIESVTPPGSDGYGEQDDRDFDRPVASIGSSYVV